MKYYGNYDKMLSDYGATFRTRKRGIIIYLLLAITCVIFSIILFVNNNIPFGIGLIFLALTFIVIFVLRFRMYYILETNNELLFNQVFEDYKNKKLLNDLAIAGFKKDNTDAVIYPDGYLKVCYMYSEYCFIEYKIGFNYYAYGYQVTDKVLSCDKDIFDKIIKKRDYNKFTNVKTKHMNKNALYQAMYKNFTDAKDFENLNQKCIQVVKEHKKTY